MQFITHKELRKKWTENQYSNAIQNYQAIIAANEKRIAYDENGFEKDNAYNRLTRASIKYFQRLIETFISELEEMRINIDNAEHLIQMQEIWLDKLNSLVGYHEDMFYLLDPSYRPDDNGMGTSMLVRMDNPEAFFNDTDKLFHEGYRTVIITSLTVYKSSFLNLRYISIIFYPLIEDLSEE